MNTSYFALKNVKWRFVDQVNDFGRQRGCPLHFRLNEHRFAVKRHDISLLITIHVNNCEHTFDWENIEILNTGNSKNIF